MAEENRETPGLGVGLSADGTTAKNRIGVNTARPTNIEAPGAVSRLPVSDLLRYQSSVSRLPISDLSRFQRQSQIKSFLLQHGITEPAGLDHWSKASVTLLRGLALLPELRFCLDLLLDELAHAQQQVKRLTVRLK